MNTIRGRITSIESAGNLSIVALDVSGVTLKSLVLENPGTASYLSGGRTVNILFKETEVVIATGDVATISLQNRLKGKVTAIDRGRLISRVVMDTEIGTVVSVVTTAAVDQLVLQPGNLVTALIKTNEIILSE